MPRALHGQDEHVVAAVGAAVGEAQRERRAWLDDAHDVAEQRGVRGVVPHAQRGELVVRVGEDIAVVAAVKRGERQVPEVSLDKLIEPALGVQVVHLEDVGDIESLKPDERRGQVDHRPLVRLEVQYWHALRARERDAERAHVAQIATRRLQVELIQSKTGKLGHLEQDVLWKFQDAPRSCCEDAERLEQGQRLIEDRPQAIVFFQDELGAAADAEREMADGRDVLSEEHQYLLQLGGIAVWEGELHIEVDDDGLAARKAQWEEVERDRGRLEVRPQRWSAQHEVSPGNTRLQGACAIPERESPEDGRKELLGERTADER